MYTITILSDNEFDKLGVEDTKGSDISLSLGFANKFTGKAYVRQVGIPELQKYLIAHELEELIDQHSEHEDENGIRHKSLSQAFSGITSAGSGVDVGGKNALGQALGGGGGRGFLGGLGKLAGSAFTGLGSLGAKALPGATSAVSNLFGGGGQASPTRGLAQRSLGFGGGRVPQSFGGGVGTGSFGRGGPTFSTAQTKAPVPGGGALSQLFGLGKGLLGNNRALAGLGGAGLLGSGLLKGFPSAPDLNTDAINQLRSQIQGGGTALGQQARGRLGEDLSKEFDPLSEEELQAATRQLDRDEEESINAVKDVFRNARPGSTPDTDAAFAKELDRVRSSFSERRADTVAQLTRTTETDFLNRRRQQIQDSLGASDAELDQLAALAQLDINTIVTQHGLDVDQARFIKETFSGLGANLLTGAIDPAQGLLDRIFPQGAR